MLPKAYRLTRELFTPLLSSRKFRNSPHFTLLSAPSEDNRVHIGVSVSKKVSKKAVERNTVRRRVYSALKDHTKSIEPSLYLFVAKKGAQSVRGEALAKELGTLLKQNV